MNEHPDAGWTTAQWKLLGDALRTPVESRTVEQCRMVLYFRDGRPFRPLEEVWTGRPAPWTETPEAARARERRRLLRRR